MSDRANNLINNLSFAEAFFLLLSAYIIHVLLFIFACWICLEAHKMWTETTAQKTHTQNRQLINYSIRREVYHVPTCDLQQ